MKQETTGLRQRSHSSICVAGAAALFAISASAWAANDLDTPAPVGTLNADGSNTYNAEWLGHNDLQGRVTYQTTVHTQGKRVIAYAGHFNGLMMNPMTGLVERNGTSVVDVTDPRHPVYLRHIPANNGGARMVKLCDGDVLPHGMKGHVYLLRENGPMGGKAIGAHEVWDVTDPANPSLVSTPVSGLDVTHRNWWDCSTGIAYIVGGATRTTDPSPDGWNNASGPNQHLKIFDLSDPASPKYIMDFGFQGQNPGSTFVMPGTENTTRTVPPGVHGPIVVSTFKGTAVNRLYMPYGVGSDGIVQIVDLKKMLPPPYGTGQYANPARPTDAELLQSQIGVIYMPGADGGHSSMPYYGIKVKQFANFTSNNVRDILAVSSEETDNRCTGSPHLLYLLDITATIGQGGSTSAEQHPWPISTVTVDDFSGRPNFCSRGTRFGVHSMAENFNDPYYGRLMTSAWFDAGIRVTDIRAPYHPVEVAHFIPPVNSFTQPSSWVINGVAGSSLDVSCDNTDVDDRGLLYCGDRVGGGLDVVKLNGKAAHIGRAHDD
ncbi:MAG: hypothetical protein E6H52_05270 [Betaproteobacteria bacterium]|nr:MAG: hypothetical protein E6H52_05270 [Betaproteobacteria bacterium]